MPFTDADLLHALRDCYVPGQRSNIVDLRLIRSATLHPDHDAPGAGIQGVPPRFLARISLHAPGSDDTVNAQLAAIIENRLAGVPAISRAEINMLPALFPIVAAS